MAGLNDIVIDKVNGLLRAGANEDRISCLICGGVEIANTLPLNKLTVPMYSLQDAEALGITELYDSVNKVLIHHHIKEYFQPFGEKISSRPAKPLYLFMVSQSIPMSVMCDKNETNSAYKAARDSGYKIKRFMVVLNPIDAYVPDIAANGFDVDVALAIAKAEACANALYDEHGTVHFYLEGRDFAPAVPGDAVAMDTFESENVCVVFYQDLSVSGSDALHHGYAAVGTHVGMVTSKPTLADCPAETGLNYQGNIQDIAEGRFLNYGFGNKPLAQWSLNAQNAFYDKKYILVRTFAETPGVFITQSFTCAKVTSDFIFSELNEVHNKAHRGIYKAYVPYINTKIRLVPSTGYIPGDVAKDLERVGNAVFGAMVNAGEISGGKTYIDPAQTIAVSRKLTVKWKMVPVGKIEAMEGELSFVVGL